MYSERWLIHLKAQVAELPITQENGNIDGDLPSTKLTACAVLVSEAVSAYNISIVDGKSWIPLITQFSVDLYNTSVKLTAPGMLSNIAQFDGSILLSSRRIAMPCI